MLDIETKKRIDDCRDILVGRITDPKSQVEQITIAMIYKFMDDMDIESEELGGSRQFFVGDFQKYSWSKIFSPRLDAHEMLHLYGEGIEKMSQNPNLNPLFRNIFRDAYLPYRDTETLKLFLRSIDGFSYDHSEKLGDAYEYLLSVLGSQGKAGQFRTPRHIIDFIVDLVKPKKGDRILDPACGTSGFLISSYRRILERNTNKRLGDKLSSVEKKELLNSINGYDLDPNMVKLSLVNLFLHGFTEDELNIVEYDTLTSEDRWNEHFDVILANPPFFSPTGGIRPHNRFSVKSNRAEVLFVNYIMEHLTPKGRAGIVVPEGIISTTEIAYKQLRKSLIEKFLIGVISLPQGVFNPYSGSKTSILFLDRKLSQKTNKIFFGKVENDGFNLGAQRSEIDKNDLPLIKEVVLEYINSLCLGEDKEHPNLNFVLKEEILNSSDIELIYERYSIRKLKSSFEVYNLKELVEFKRGTPLTKKKAVQGMYPVIAGGKKPAFYHNEYNRDGEIVTISSSGAAGFVNFFDNPIFMSDSFSIKSVNEKKLITKFLYLLLKGKQEYIYSLQTGVAQRHVYPKSFENFQIPLPPFEIQKKIVEKIEQLQKVIDGAKKVVDNYKPYFEIDENWEKIKLGDIGKVSMCKRIYKQQTKSYGDIPFYKIGTFGGTPNAYIKIDLYNDYKSKYSFPKKGDILISTSGTIGKIVEYDGNDAYFQDSNIVWISNDETKVSNKFLKFCYHIINWSPKTGVTIARLYNKIIENTLIPKPPIEIQNKIVEKLEKERKIVEGNTKLIEIYSQKINDRINKVWTSK